MPALALRKDFEGWAIFYCIFSAKDLLVSTILCIFVLSNEVDKELLTFTLIAVNSVLMYVTYSKPLQFVGSKHVRKSVSYQ